MPLPPSTTEPITSLEQYSDVVSWINDILDASEDDEETESPAPTELTELDEHVTQLLATLDIACEDTSSQLEHTIDDVSRGVPRLTYDLHFMKDNAMSLQATLSNVLQRSKDAVPDSTSVALDHLRHLDLIKGRMEATREALREAESWSSLELEVTSLLAERSYAKAAERLSEASRSMVVFHNTPEYEPRRTLMVSLQNQLEASLSSALVAAINSQDVAVCRNYFSIFSHIQRESEFRNYYNASRRASVVALWHDVSLVDCESPATTPSVPPPEPFANFLPRFYGSFLSLLNLERVSITAIFPDPALTLSAFISSTLSSLQPTFSQRLSSLSSHHSESALHQLISLLRATEEFASSVEKAIEKTSYAATPSASDGASPEIAPHPNARSHTRRRSTRMSISWRPGAHLPSAGPGGVSKALLLDGMEWEQELFQPFLDFQIDYGSLERRLLEHALHNIISSDTNDKIPDADRARLFRERAVDVITIAEESLTRYTAFTHGYGSVGLVLALDNFFRSFIDIWTADVRLETRTSSSQSQIPTSDDDLSDMDYSTQDWSDFQLSLHLLSSARAVYERISSFEAKLRSSLLQTAIRFRLARDNSNGFTIAPSRGESQLLEQSPLNSADLHALFTSVEADTQSRESSLPSSRHSQFPVAPGSPDPLLIEARRAIFTFANSCQVSLQGTILSPLWKHLASYASSPLWNAPGDPKSKRTMTANELQVPSFSLSPSDAVQRVAEGLLNLPRLFEVYADDDALAFSLHTLPHVDAETLKGLSEQISSETLAPPTHMRRSSLSTIKPTPVDPDAVSSAWLSSLGHTLLEHLTTTVLPNIPSVSPAGAAQLASDLEYLSNIVHAINVEFPELDRWKELIELDDDEGRKRLSEADEVDHVLRIVARLRSWR
ncbi:Golgi complex component 7-domain-containing protein [Lyophyllum atratum]|nr:Golgi complex component 7-domain-containing protein [Lyophyllum atratum]